MKADDCPPRRCVRALDGWLLLDKAAGITSFAALRRVKGLLAVRKAGHGGTLDPFATGLLPLAFGEATKMISLVMDGVKTYRFTVRWGVETDTLDSDGAVTATDARRPEPAAIQAILPDFIGQLLQTPPAFSALHVEGVRAYELARQGRPPILPPRPVSVSALRLLAIPDRDHADFEVTCGKGFYVRSLGRDLAKTLGCMGHVRTLRRTGVGRFAIEQAVSLAVAAENGHVCDALEAAFLPLEAALDGIPALPIGALEAERLRQGRFLPRPAAEAPEVEAFPPLEPDPGVMVAVASGRAVALVRLDREWIRPVRVFAREAAVFPPSMTAKG